MMTPHPMAFQGKPGWLVGQQMKPHQSAIITDKRCRLPIEEAGMSQRSKLIFPYRAGLPTDRQIHKCV